MIGTEKYRSKLVDPLFELGEILLKSYGKVSGVTAKEDFSPVTNRDLFSHQFLSEQLRSLSNNPILSEEACISFEERVNWEQFWIVDPLDGTKAYIKGQGDFTVNIALINHGRPIEAFILSPIRGELYYAKYGCGAYLVTKDGKESTLPVKRGDQTVLFTSESHEGAEMDRFVQKHPTIEKIPMSSAIKFGLVAESDAAFYLRFAGCSEWDIAAGDLIVSEAGGGLINIGSKKPMKYNSPSLRVPPFIAFSGGIEPFNFISDLSS